MSRIVAALERAGLVHIKTDKSDRRAVAISATEAGVRLMQQARTRRVESLARALAALPELRIEQLRHAAEMIEGLSRGV
jgi:DNA-binding MarR family transcriptional regulator